MFRNGEIEFTVSLISMQTLFSELEISLKFLSFIIYINVKLHIFYSPALYYLLQLEYLLCYLNIILINLTRLKAVASCCRIKFIDFYVSKNCFNIALTAVSAKYPSSQKPSPQQTSSNSGNSSRIALFVLPLNS